MIESGALIVNKHAGVTSHDIVNRIRRLYGTKKVGHTGTLDPMATGVLVVLVGRAVKASEYLTGCSKQYTATLRLGITTDTEDTTGTVLTRCEALPSADEVIRAARGFVGDVEQMPPMYSALKVGGRKLVDLAREGKVVERQARTVRIDALDIEPTKELSDYILTVDCSGGTYIRTLCADIGASLGCGGVMASLVRNRVDRFGLEMAHTIEKLEQMEMDERYSLLIPTEELFAGYPSVRLIPFFEKLLRSGCHIYQKKIGTHYAIGERVRVCDENGKFIALGKVTDTDEGSAIKSIKIFDLN